MPKIAYKVHRFRDASLQKIVIAREILDEYAAQGFDLTLRQLYYQFVARNYIPNRDNEYDKLGTLINNARLAGLIDWNQIVDRTRNVRARPHWSSPADIIKSAASSYAIDCWSNQPEIIEVWIEKDALVGVVEPTCREHDVALFSCRGYTSSSEIWRAAQRHLRYTMNGKRVRVLHMGDHDPSGIDMTRDIRDRLELFCEHAGYDAPRVERIALTMEQVKEYEPPPDPAKVTDSRFTSYWAEYGNESWELDALEPRVLTGLIEEHIAGIIDGGLWNIRLKREQEERAQLQKISDRWSDVEQMLHDEEEYDNYEDDDV
jgi:hypothetical protein